MPEQESQRLSTSQSKKSYQYRHNNDNEDNNEDDDEFNADKQPVDRKANKTYDMEVYDDRSFYSMLLKTFITSSTAASSASQGAGTSGTLFGSSLRGDDLEALRKYKRKKLDVERKASKGRKIRYTVHTKLQNFMFPVPLIPPSHLDVERLHASLFQ